MINEFHSENRKSPGADMAGRYAVSGRFFRLALSEKAINITIIL